jgi:hypothetical protein
MAHDIRVENNILAFGDEYAITLPRSQRIAFARNIILTANEPVFADSLGDPREHVSASDANLFWSTQGARPRLGKIGWEEWLKSGFDGKSAFADPLFAGVSKDAFAVREGSPALGLGFQPLELGEVPPAQ